jgi:hypothetical protein
VRRNWFFVLLVAATVAGCGVRPFETGVEVGQVGRFRQVAILPLLSDDLRLQGTSTPSGADTVSTGWDTPRLTGQMAREILAPAGTQVIPLLPPALAANELSATDWPERIWRHLRDAQALGGAEAVILLRQNAIDGQGRQYSPVPDFFGFGLVGVVVGAATRSERFWPAFSLAVHTGLDEALLGPSRCGIGFDARLVDAATGTVRASSNAVLGIEILRTPLGPVGAKLSDAQREIARTYCLAALRRGVSEAIRELELTGRP